MALIELYRTTGTRAYLNLAGYLLSGVETERLHLMPSQVSYLFSGIPFTSRTIFEGHAVRSMYASSGAGSRSDGESFGDPYELPNSQAYTESCAAIGNMMWNFRMLAASGESRFADVMERALYNGINSGMSLDGCPPNIERILAWLPGYFYSTSKDGLYVNFYHDSELNWQGLKVTQKTSYPWSGDVQFTVTPETAREFTMFLRIPAWSRNSSVLLNGSTIPAQPGQYLALRISEDTGKVPLQRGPLVYCLERPDQSAKIPDLSLTHPDANFETQIRKDLLGGVVILKHPGATYNQPLDHEPLYQASQRKQSPVSLTFIPYYAWANREQSAMEVWIPLK
jgi:DUF1680 family protein